jgi:hypothetical protein
VKLSGDEEVPPRETPAHGVTKLKVAKDGASVDYFINVARISNIVQAHIHIGPRGENGPVVVFLHPLVPPNGGPSQGRLISGSFTQADLIPRPAIGFGGTMAELLAAICSGNAYVNVHTDDGVAPPNTGPGDFPGGEIRGQIEPHGGH